MSEHTGWKPYAVDGEHRLAALWTLYLSLDSIAASEGAAAAAPSGRAGDRPSGRSPARGPDTTPRYVLCQEGIPEPGQSAVPEGRNAGDGGRPAALPARAYSPAQGNALRELAAALTDIADEARGLSDGSRERRVAELLEFLDFDTAARTWWVVAAHLGDQDAIDYLEILDEEHGTSTAVRAADCRRTVGDYRGVVEAMFMLSLESRAMQDSDCATGGRPTMLLGDWLTQHPVVSVRYDLGNGSRHGSAGSDATRDSRLQPQLPQDGVSALADLARELVREIEEYLANPGTLAGDRGGGTG